MILTVLLMMLPGLSLSEEIDIPRFIETASIVYEKQFEIEGTVDTLNRMFANPVLTSEIWRLYDFSPPYLVNTNDSGYRVVDPTGIRGDLVLIRNNRGMRIYMGNGRMKNWFVPFSLRGKALFIIRYRQVGGSLLCSMNIYGESGSDLLSKILLKAVSPLLHKGIDKRVTRNLRDLRILTSDIERNPENIRPLLDPRSVEAFDRLFVEKSGDPQ